MLYFSRWKTTLIWLAILASVVFAAPNLLSQQQLAALPDWMPKKQLTLGLDLQGGSHILLRVEREDIEKERLETVVDDMRRLLREEGIGYTGLSGNGLVAQVRIRDSANIERAKDALSELTQLVNAGLLGGGALREAELDEPQPGLLRITLTEEGINHRISSAVSQSIEVVRRRVDELGTTEPVIQRQGTDRILVQVPGFDDPQRLKDILNQTAKLTFHLVDRSMPAEEALRGRPPVSSEIVYSNDDPPIPFLLQRRPLLSGDNLVDAQAGFDQRTNEPIVTFRFDTAGAQRFGQITQQNVGYPFAIVLDEAVITAPVINEPILGGTGQISGNFTVESANDLAVLLRAGALPATLTVIEERTVGPGLGADSIAAGEIAGIIGAILVVTFIFAAYGFLGLIANLALIFNVTMIIALLTLIGATLTLPGIAGIVLTVGMAVDSNVLIYERIREERRGGRSLIQAIDAGFQRAFATILDANITTLIAAVILFYLGSGPVRGFAVTLAIGIVTTVFTAFTVTRWMIAEWVRRSRPKALPRGLLAELFGNAHYKFMWLRKFTFMFSAAAALASLVLFATVGMNYGIDFKGGSVIEVQSKSGPADVSDIRSRLSDLNLGDVQVQEFGSPEEVLIRVQAQGGGENAEQTVITKVRGDLEDDYTIRRVEVVGPTVSGELAQAGTIAVLTSLFAILIYIWFRFEWQFALGAIIATVNDVILTIGMFVITGVEFNLSSIAAVLTIVGYSLNDTVVVYDRVRENLRRYKKMPLPDLLDLSVNQMLSRTVLTSVTTLLALLSLFIFGGEVIRSFTFAMIFGVIIGTYSSTFIAAPVLILFKLRGENFQAGMGKDEEQQQGEESKGPAPGTA
ncbi:protein translocase subunit SecDF [Hoeflea prorocentri]|uniref:Multifunctional fusion protein n=1 Tax=Hoeflea prorocentri TaxID=1922333 RepID=A0A9X3ZH60_9HYPH|nr:protein translocase subunit SecDF [Hoeflea prorocentri]MCY6380593.1 protein translocase subunit SecDF [Hoeflea prorocentri]MDA5398393.1 protein translocase subunit SecDF [Hoeflea prorocentri]